MSCLDIYKGFVNANFPFLRIINHDAVFADETPYELIHSFFGWTIYDYGDSIEIRSPYEESGISEPMALMLREQIMVVSEMMELVANKKWKTIELVDGTRILQFILWVETERYKLVLKHYKPNEKELTWYNEIKEYALQNQIPFNKSVIKEDVPLQKSIADSRVWVEAATELKLH